MRFSSFTEAIDTVGAELDGVDTALFAGDAVALQAGTEAVRQASIDFSEFLSAFTQADLLRAGVLPRLQAVARRLGRQREGLARRAFVVERQVACLVPAAQGVSSTYGPASAASSPGRGAAVSRIYANRAL